MSKSAMQELWEYIDANYHEEGFNIYAAKKLSLEKEKEQIMQSYNDGYVNKAFDKSRNPLEYYNQTYNQEETLEEWKSKFTHHCAIKTYNQ